MQKKYKLIQCYPASEDLGTVVEEEGIYFINKLTGRTYHRLFIIDYPSFWQEIKEVKLEVPIGTKFKDNHRDIIFTITKCDDFVHVSVFYDDDIKYYIEDVNNRFQNGTWTIYKEKEFEVLELTDRWNQEGVLIDRGGDKWCGKNTTDCSLNWLLQKGCKIKKVKRLSDGGIFSVGDKVFWDWYDAEGVKYFTISKFYYNEDEILVFDTKESKGKGFWLKLCKLQHYKEPLFLDELGNEVYEGDLYYFVSKDGMRLLSTIAEKKGGSGKSSELYIYFKNKVDAEKYISDNKPTFSRKQILDAKNKLILHMAINNVTLLDSFFKTFDEELKL